MRESCEPLRPALQIPRATSVPIPRARSQCKRGPRLRRTNPRAHGRQSGTGGGRGVLRPMLTDIIEWRWPDLALRLQAEGLTSAEP